MKQYIDKAILVAEIEKRIEAHKETLKNCDSSISEMVLKGSTSAYQSLQYFLSTLEAKEVGLKKDFELTWEDVAWIVNETILKCKVESALTAEDICKDVLKLFKAKKGDIV